MTLVKMTPPLQRFATEVALPLNNQIEKTALSSGQVIRCGPILKDLREFFDFAESAKLAMVAETANIGSLKS
jgi:hypothetical protein